MNDYEAPARVLFCGLVAFGVLIGLALAAIIWWLS